MAESELDLIIESVISSLQTNSKTIEQLTAVETLCENDFFEVNGGRKVSYSIIKDLIVALSKKEVSNLIDNKTLKDVEFVVTDKDATLKIRSLNKEISASVPIANSKTAGLITAEDKDVIIKLKPLIQNIEQVEEVLSGGSDVVEFWDVEDFEDTVQDKTDKSAEDEGCLVVYSPGHNAFFLRVQSDWAVLYYKVWNGSSQWNRWLESAKSYRPRANKIYISVSENGGLYWWDSTELLQLGMRNEECEVIREELSRLSHELTQLIAKSESTDANVSKLDKKVTELTNNVDDLSKQVVDVEDTVMNLNDMVLNLATINGKSLLEGGDIVITGDGVMIEPIPDEFIEELGSAE